MDRIVRWVSFMGDDISSETGLKLAWGWERAGSGRAL
jgi:hypothetical protein